MKIGTRYPLRSDVATAHRRRIACWACGSEEDVSIAASADWDGGLATDPKEYGLLCSNCHLKAPQLGSAEVFWAWLARQHSGSAPVNATMASLVDELNLLPPEEREVTLTQGVGIAVLIASRGTQDHPVYREDRADRTFGEVMEEALVLVVDWLHEGTLRHRMEHPEELLTEGELRRYEIGYLRRAGHKADSEKTA